MTNNTHISVVIPVYGCSSSLNNLYNRLEKSLSKITLDFEIIFVNDASPDNAWNIISELSEKNQKVKGINFSRNFGQHYAITAGLDIANGDWVVVMDCDLQDKPEEIINLYSKAIEGFDIVLGRRINRRDSFIKKTLSKINYSILSYLTDSKIDYRVGTFRILSKNVVKQFNNMHEYFRFFGAMINWLGFDVAYIDIIHEEREYGQSSYSIKKLIKLALNGMLSFSDKPLRMTIKMGFFIVIVSSIFIIYKIIYVINNGTTAIGWSSLIAAVFFSTGLIVSVLGVIGLYIGRIFEQVKHRPLYIIKSKTKNI